MDIIVGIGMIMVLVAIGIVLAWFFARKNLPSYLKNPFMAFVTAIALVVVGWYGFGAGDGFNELLGGVEQRYVPTEPTTAVGYQYASFDINPSAVTSGANAYTTINSAKTTFSVPAIANSTSHTVKQLNGGAWANPKFKFDITPIAWAGASTTDLATIYFEVVNPDVTVDVSSTGLTYYLVSKTGSNRLWTWTGTVGTTSIPTKYVSGSISMQLTSNATLYLVPTINTDSFSRMESTYDPLDVTIRFHNGDNSWVKTYTIQFFVTTIQT